jgi:hypothetical protein
VFARVYGAETPFEAHTDESLMLRLAQAPEDYRAADEFYQYELLAHKIQLAVINDGSSELHNVRIHVRLQRIDGAGLSDRVYLENGEDPATGEYPKITAMDRRFSIEADFPSLRPGSSGNLFATEPRLWVREAAGGKSIVVDYSVEADELASAVRDSLIIHICALDPTA